MLYKIVTIDSYLDPDFQVPIAVPTNILMTYEQAESYGVSWIETFPTDIVMLVEVP